jgi:hypothetical protein
MFECVRAACRVDKIDFTCTFEEFADLVDLSDLTAFQQQNGGDDTEGSGSKKK